MIRFLFQEEPVDLGPGCGVMLEMSAPMSVPIGYVCTNLYHVFGVKSLK